MPSFDHDSWVSQLRLTPGELPQEPADADGGPTESSSEPPAELDKLATESSDAPDGLSDSLSETDWETTRYLAVATQLNLRYARFVVSQIIGEPFRAVAPAAGADVVVVTRWALAALRRRAWRDAVSIETALTKKKLNRPRIESLIAKITPAVAGVTALADAIDAVHTAVSHL